jgi:septal ring-binding cell division protein DamX
MSSQPTTPKPSNATTLGSSGSPTISNNNTENNNMMPLDQQQQQQQQGKYNNGVVTPGTPSNNNNESTPYSPHTNTIRTTAHRKDSIVPNINETCPSFGPTEYHHNIISMDRHSM